VDYEHEEKIFLANCRESVVHFLFPKYSTGVYPFKSNTGPGGNFEVSASVPVTLSNPILTGCKTVPFDNFISRRVLKARILLSDNFTAICLL
jgi:hypothetical protein